MWPRSKVSSSSWGEICSAVERVPFLPPCIIYGIFERPFPLYSQAAVLCSSCFWGSLDSLLGGCGLPRVNQTSPFLHLLRDGVGCVFLIFCCVLVKTCSQSWRGWTCLWRAVFSFSELMLESVSPSCWISLQTAGQSLPSLGVCSAAVPQTPVYPSAVLRLLCTRLSAVPHTSVYPSVLFVLIKVCPSFQSLLASLVFSLFLISVFSVVIFIVSFLTF